jgi:SAM-dependent methyltransferase
MEGKDICLALADKPEPAAISKEEFLRLYSGIVADYPILGQGSQTVRRYFRSMELFSRVCPRGSLVLDVGAWPGTLAVWLKRAGWKVWAIDKDAKREAKYSSQSLIVPDMGSNAESGSLVSICKHEQIGIESLDIERSGLPFETESVDAVICTEVIEHLWSNPLFALSEMNRVLKRDTGCLLLSTPNLTALRNRINFVLGRVHQVIEHPFVSFLKAERIGHMGHLRLYSPDELLSLLTLMGFRSTIEYDLLVLDPPDFRVNSPTNRGPDSRAPEPSTQRKRSMMRRLAKPPDQYFRAAWATLVATLEHAYPPFRQQVFVVATKVTDSDYERNHEEAFRRLVMENRFN